MTTTNINTKAVVAIGSVDYFFVQNDESSVRRVPKSEVLSSDLLTETNTREMTNKTIDTAGPNTIKINGNTLAASAGTATLTLPNTTDTIVGRATTDTLTNKTLTSPTINAGTISGTFGGAATFSGAITFSNSISVGTTLGVTGAATLSSTLAVTGATTLTGAATVNNTVTVSASNATTATDYFSLVPTDYGAGKPKLVVAKKAASQEWEFKLVNHNNGLGKIDFTADTLSWGGYTILTTNSPSMTTPTITSPNTRYLFSTIATNAAATIVVGTDGEYIQHTGTLNADRLITLSTSGVQTGNRFRITRTGSGAFNLSIGGLKNLVQNTWCEVVYNGSAWVLVAYGAL